MVRAGRLPWPVAPRPLRGEILYSWLARTAGIYDLTPDELLTVDNAASLDILVNGTGSPSAIKHLSALARMPVARLLRMTLQGIRPKWPDHWRIAAASPSNGVDDHLLPSLQVCPECLNADAKGMLGTQFLRTRWQSAALTICFKHRNPLQQTCMTCRWQSWPISTRSFGRRSWFVCQQCGSPLGQRGLTDEPRDDRSFGLLACFEQQILRALANRPVGWSWVGYAEPSEFIRLIDDLIWILTLSCRQSRPIYRLQTIAFPLGLRHLPTHSTNRWYTFPPPVRRCLFAAVLGIVGSVQTRSMLNGGTLVNGWCELIDCLDAMAFAELERRSWLWPPAAHNSLRRAVPSSRGTSPPQRFSTPFSTELRKTRRRVGHFY
jgi:hypothetical protein